jgi:hypothetical protein
MGGKSSSSKSEAYSSATTNNNIDRRQVVAEGGFGLASDGATINLTQNTTTLDGGIVNAALGSVNTNIGKALDVVAQADATNGDGFTRLLNLADKFITGAGNILETTQATTQKQLDTITTAANDKSGQIDQKTIMVAVGVAGAVAIAYAVGGKK